MNYIGSKLKLCTDFIPQVVQATCGNNLQDKVFCDLFAGTGIVGRTFKSRCAQIISNDFEFYSFVLNKNYIGNHLPLNSIDSLIDYLNNLPDYEGFIFNNYCFGGSSKRLYFTDENGRKIDAIRQQIKVWKNKKIISDEEYFCLLCSLLESADEVANTASVYAAFLKKIKRSAQKPLVLKKAAFELTKAEHLVFNQDADELIKKIKGDILYLDPPYNTRQYGAYYHLLNTIALYEPFIPKGVTGVPEYKKSAWCSTQTVEEKLKNLITAASFKYIFLSYNNEGLLSFKTIKRVFEQFGHYDCFEKKYSRFKADSKRLNRANFTIEYLHVLEKY